MTGGCVICGRPVKRHHHLTARDAHASYLDKALWVGVCHDHHELAHDDWHTAKLETTTSPLTWLERVEVRLRRLAMFLARLVEPFPENRLWAVLAACVEGWAGELRRHRRCQDARDPGWRSDPGFYPPGELPAG